MSEKVIQLKYADIYRKEKLILSDVNLEVEKGDFYFLIGKVGSGKTSLIKTLYAELPLVKGTCYVAGFHVNNIEPTKIPFLRRSIGIVFQDFQLLEELTVYQNLKTVLKATGTTKTSKINKRIEEVLTEVDLLNKAESFPHELSGGEQQRVVIARAILNNPPLILADEPTGNLDPDSSKIIIDIFKRLQSLGTAIVVATHNYSLLKYLNSKVLKIENQKLILENHDEIDFSVFD
jgi:cell division transport system ATP-binding protein